jgi:hypothetical protein
VIQVTIQAEYAEASAVVEGGVLEEPLPVDAHELDVHLDGIARLFLRKQAHLLRSPLASARQLTQSQIAKQPLNRLSGDRNSVNPLEPDARTSRAKTLFEPRLFDQWDDLRLHSGAASFRVSR